MTDERDLGMVPFSVYERRLEIEEGWRRHVEQQLAAMHAVLRAVQDDMLAYIGGDDFGLERASGRIDAALSTPTEERS